MEKEKKKQTKRITKYIIYSKILFVYLHLNVFFYLFRSKYKKIKQTFKQLEYYSRYLLIKKKKEEILYNC